MTSLTLLFVGFSSQTKPSIRASEFLSHFRLLPMIDEQRYSQLSTQCTELNVSWVQGNINIALSVPYTKPLARGNMSILFLQLLWNLYVFSFC